MYKLNCALVPLCEITPTRIHQSKIIKPNFFFSLLASIATSRLSAEWLKVQEVSIKEGQKKKRKKVRRVYS